MSVVLKLRCPANWAANNRMASLGHPLAVGFVDGDPGREKRETVGQINPRCADQVGVCLRNAKAGIEPVELNAGAAYRRFAESSTRARKAC